MFAEIPKDIKLWDHQRHALEFLVKRLGDGAELHGVSDVTGVPARGGQRGRRAGGGSPGPFAALTPTAVWRVSP